MSTPLLFEYFFGYPNLNFIEWSLFALNIQILLFMFMYASIILYIGLKREYQEKTYR